MVRQGPAARARPARHRHPRAAHRLGLPDRRRRHHRHLHPAPERQLRRALAGRRSPRSSPASCLAIWRGRTSMIRMLGVVALLSGIAYLFTPLTAAGPARRADRLRRQPPLRLARAGARRLLLAVDTRAEPGARPRAGCSAASSRAARSSASFSGGESVWDARLPARRGDPASRSSSSASRSALALAPRWGIDRWTIGGGRGARDRPRDRHRLRRRRQLPGRPLPGPRPRRATSPRASGRRSSGSTRRSRRTPASPSSAAGRASSSTSSTATTSPTTSSTSPTTSAHGAFRPIDDLRGVARGAQRRRLRLRRDRPRPAHPGRARRSRPSGPTAGGDADEAGSRTTSTFVFELAGELDPARLRPATAEAAAAASLELRRRTWRAFAGLVAVAALARARRGPAAGAPAPGLGGRPGAPRRGRDRPLDPDGPAAAARARSACSSRS